MALQYIGASENMLYTLKYLGLTRIFSGENRKISRRISIFGTRPFCGKNPQKLRVKPRESLSCHPGHPNRRGCAGHGTADVRNHLSPKWLGKNGDQYNKLIDIMYIIDIIAIIDIIEIIKIIYIIDIIDIDRGSFCQMAYQ